MRDQDELFAALRRSGYRRRFHLGPHESTYLNRHGLTAVMVHARQFITWRVASAQPDKDGRQTPMNGHPVFIAQHATACCCRSCLQKWHYIRRGQTLSPKQIDHVLAVIRCWLLNQVALVSLLEPGQKDLPLFDMPRVK